MAQFLALTVTGLAIFRQLRAQAWANQFSIFTSWSQEWSSLTTVRYRLAWSIQIADGTRDLTPARVFIGAWFNNKARDRDHGNVNPRLAWQNLGAIAQIHWALILPLVPDLRATDPGLWADWERWVGELAERDRRAGKATDVSPERLARLVPSVIAGLIDGSAIEEDTKAGVIPVWPDPTPTSGEQDATLGALRPRNRRPAEGCRRAGDEWWLQPNNRLVVVGRQWIHARIRRRDARADRACNRCRDEQDLGL